MHRRMTTNEMIAAMPEDYREPAAGLAALTSELATTRRLFRLVLAENYAMHLHGRLGIVGSATWADRHMVNDVDLAEDIVLPEGLPCGNPQAAALRRELGGLRRARLAASPILCRTIVSEAAFMALPAGARSFQHAAYVGKMAHGHEVLAIDDLQLATLFVPGSNLQVVDAHSTLRTEVSVALSEYYDHWHTDGSPAPPGSDSASMLLDVESNGALPFSQTIERIFEHYDAEATIATLGRWATGGQQ